MDELTKRQAVNRLCVIIGISMSVIAYGLDVLADGGVGVVAFVPAVIAAGLGAFDAHRARKTDPDEDLPDGVTQVSES